MSSKTINLSSPLRELMLFMTLAGSTMQNFAMIILIPLLCKYHHKSLNSLEIGMLIAAATTGELVSFRYTEPLISKFGIKWSL